MVVDSGGHILARANLGQALPNLVRGSVDVRKAL
jgi:hypothetical protein